MSKQARNPFKEMEESIKTAPPELRKKVMSDVATAKLLIDIGSLFTFNYSTALQGLFKTWRS